MAQKYFKTSEGGLLVDVSCGSGLFSKKFAKSRAYSRVVALDFSENMLCHYFDFIKNDDTILSSKDEERGIFSMTVQLRRINRFPSKIQEYQENNFAGVTFLWTGLAWLNLGAYVYKLVPPF
ncbi:hypothetical protein CASFOL_029425 [Castilleja foliolosa]|uniref:Methyltransferase domain-containing protein n=1 Tax=Castilleja foliolosa TaxID=1961234 RepID=A0ABD3CAT4_9LAMI